MYADLYLIIWLLVTVVVSVVDPFLVTVVVVVLKKGIKLFKKTPLFFLLTITQIVVAYLVFGSSLTVVVNLS